MGLPPVYGISVAPDGNTATFSAVDVKSNLWLLKGLTDRGVLRSGMTADVLVIDREALGTSESPRYVGDLPANSGRYVVDATGYRMVIVNGEPLLRDGEATGATPGKLLR